MESATTVSNSNTNTNSWCIPNLMEERGLLRPHLNWPNVQLQNQNQKLYSDHQDSPIILDNCECGSETVHAICPETYYQLTPPFTRAIYRTCWKRIGRNRFLVVREEESIPKCSSTIGIKMVVFIFCLVLLTLAVFRLSFMFARSQEILVVTLLLLLTLLLFKPRHFLPDVIMTSARTSEKARPEYERFPIDEQRPKKVTPLNLMSLFK